MSIDIDDVKTLNVGPDDVLIIKTTKMLSLEQREWLQNHLVVNMPTIKTVIIGPDIEFAVVSHTAIP